MENNNKDDIFEFISQESNKLDSYIAKLQEDLTYEKDARREERFIFILILVILLDVVFFSVMPTLSGPIALLLLELLFLFPLAKRLGMEGIAEIIDRIVDRIMIKKKE